MRSERLIPAMAAAMALLTFIPAGAAAATATSSRHGRHHRRHVRHIVLPRPNHCRVNIDVAPREITAGDPVTIFGRLLCRRPGSEAGQVVKLFHHLPGSFGFSYVQSTTTDAHGFYEFTRADGVVDTNRSWFVQARGARSFAKRIRVAAQVTLSGPAEGTQLLTGRQNRVTFAGTVSPADVGARVILQRQNADTGSDWRRIDSGRVQNGGSFAIAHAFIVPGDANIRVLVRSQGRNIPSSSNVLEYEISQAQNPALTILASADPIVFGQSVTLTGVLAGGASQPVTLLARTRRQHGFAPVAQVNTDAAGNYSFPPQAPVNSTFYEVVAGAPACPEATPPLPRCLAMRMLRSAVLYEGVKDILTAQVSTTTVQAGQQVTFTGTVAPSHPGHVIYLERQNASGQGFHVVQVGIVNPDSTFSIAHTVYDPGMKVFRVFIPGGPENLGAASQPFTIQVTPAPAATLVPEAPGNSSLPSEGSEGRGEGGREAD